MTPEKLAKLTPAQREHYEMWQARAEQARAGGPVVDGRLAGKALLGPAGEAMAGIVKLERPERIKDPAEWERVMRAELAPRDAAREPYLASARPPLRISRIVTRGKTQAQDVAAHLAACGLAARPDLVYGLYRVPDRIRPSAGPEGRRVVEWDIVHAATDAAPARRRPRRHLLRRRGDLGRAPDRRAVRARRGPRARLPRAGGDRPGADARHLPPRHDRPARRRQRGVRFAHDGPRPRRARVPPAQRRRERRARDGRRRAARPPGGPARGRPRRARQLGRDRPGRPPRAPAAPVAAIAVRLPAADAPGAAARLPRRSSASRRRTATACRSPTAARSTCWPGRAPPGASSGPPAATRCPAPTARTACACTAAPTS